MRLIDADHFSKRLWERINELETNPLYTDAEKEMSGDIIMSVLEKLREEETVTESEEKKK